MYKVQVTHQWIEMKDGVRLEAKLWRPDHQSETFPAILEYLPYRHSDFTYYRDELRHPWFCERGYVCVRVDMRGSGNSEGYYYDEYEVQEQEDCLQVIDWISKQPWCTGSVGMYGKSWGGFNGLQVAFRQPPALKAIISLYSTDDRYMDDFHHIGGCMIGSGLLSWASYMLASNAAPPLPWHVGKSWKEKWLDRLQKAYYPWSHTWVSHMTKDEHWKHASISEDYSKVNCAVLLMGGWIDCYSNAVFRMVEHLEAPCRALVGPWSHEWPDIACPGPRIGYLTECLRWWEKHLKGVENGVMEDPKFRIYIREGIKPAFEVDTWPGRWVSVDSWPSSDVKITQYQLNKDGDLVLAEESCSELLSQVPLQDEDPVRVRGSLLCGQNSGVFLSFGDNLPLDQSTDDGLSLCWQTRSLKEPIDILGSPQVVLHLSIDQPQGFVAVRLCDVLPDGTSCLISRGFLNLTHRQGHSPEAVQPLVPGEKYSVSVPLDYIGHHVAAGHRLRLAVSPTYWPLIWPSPRLVLLSVFPGQCGLSLPIYTETEDAKQRNTSLRDLGVPEQKPSVGYQEIRRPSDMCKYERSFSDGKLCMTVTMDDGHFKVLESGEEVDGFCQEVYTVDESDPLSARVVVKTDVKMSQKGVLPDEDWLVNLSFQSEMTCDENSFYIKTDASIDHEKKTVYEKSWKKTIKRFGL